MFANVIVQHCFLSFQYVFSSFFFIISDLSHTYMLNNVDIMDTIVLFFSQSKIFQISYFLPGLYFSSLYISIIFYLKLSIIFLESHLHNCVLLILSDIIFSKTKIFFLSFFLKSLFII